MIHSHSVFRARRWAAPLLCVSFAFLSLASCGDDAPPPNNQPGAVDPTPTLSVTPSSSPGRTSPTSGLWVTYAVGEDLFQANVTNADSIQQTLRRFDAGEATSPVAGEVAAGTEFNRSWSWHLAPSSVEYRVFIDAPPAECSTPPSIFESSGAWRTCQSYTPSSARIQAVEDCRSGECQPRPRVSPSPSPSPSPTGSYQPCGGKICGDQCTLCDPNDPQCVETQVLKYCNAGGECSVHVPACPSPLLR